MKKFILCIFAVQLIFPSLVLGEAIFLNHSPPEAHFELSQELYNAMKQDLINSEGYELVLSEEQATIILTPSILAVDALTFAVLDSLNKETGESKQEKLTIESMHHLDFVAERLLSLHLKGYNDAKVRRQGKKIGQWSISLGAFSLYHLFSHTGDLFQINFGYGFLLGQDRLKLEYKTAWNNVVPGHDFANISGVSIGYTHALRETKDSPILYAGVFRGNLIWGRQEKIGPLYSDFLLDAIYFTNKNSKKVTLVEMGLGYLLDQYSDKSLEVCLVYSKFMASINGESPSSIAGNFTLHF